MSSDLSPTGGGTTSLAASANGSHNTSPAHPSKSDRDASPAPINATATTSAINASNSSNSASPHGSGSNSSANHKQDNIPNANTSQTRTSGGGAGAGGGAGGSGPRKNSAERGIAHTRMDDESVQQEYKYGQILGEGSFGKVYRAQHVQTGEVVAIKEIVKEKAGSSGLKQLDKEVSIFKKVDHKNIIKLKEVLESPKKMYLIMEVCEGGDLAKLLQKRQHLSEADTKQVMFSLAEAIKYLHQVGILHRDLKLENLLLADDPGDDGPINIKVSDFGLSTQQNNNSYENMQEQYCGTPSYMAPEMNSTYSYPVDVWAMGIIMYYLLTKYPKDNELNETIAKDGPKFNEPQWKNISDQAKKLLEEMLTINPAYRLSSGELLNHEWFTGKKREYGNVLELMKDFSREQKEAATNNDDSSRVSCGELDGSDSIAMNGGTSTPCSKDSGKQKSPRKGSGSKKGSAGDASLKLPASSMYLKPQTKKGGVSSLTSSPRPPSKTPTPKDAGSSTRATVPGTKTTATKTSSKPQAFTPVNGPSTSRVSQPSAVSSSKPAATQKAKKK
ncbi:serine/threonine-protein kinase 33 [Plakobranchus ocellatus]|uniref:non-specific serine/threonine protein kinase n=1 Tax=Plakobranchus ocellatus TaxID=259542 RepID=A0AAV3X7V4_9GAST|nr:serine/threonine-protein kinase 33 [Plakobranchus ocellatus]